MDKLSKHIIPALSLILLILAFSVANAQSKKQLEQKKKKLQQEISYTNKLLKKAQKNRQASLNELIKLNKKISTRQELVNTINHEIKILNLQIIQKQALIKSLENDLNNLKSEYANMIYAAYKHHNDYEKLAYIFSSKDFNQAYKRLKYLQQYAEYRKKQAQAIIETKEKLQKEVAELEQKKQEKQNLLLEKTEETNILSKEKTTQEKTITQLQQQERELRKKLKDAQRQARRLDDAIQKIIAEEIKKARENKKATSKGSKGFPMTPEALKLSNSFAANKGKLPWPVEKGIITGKFGEQPHPVLKEVIVKNNGIDISTEKGADVRAVYNGEVSSVVIIPGAGKVVMVRHGEYLTVYSYLSEVYVKKGDKVTIKQPLGKLVKDSSKPDSKMHFEIWKGMTKLNPAYWIYK
ncbi:MAG TPA: peptidase M23 [Flavobacteriales bacterium]|nr:peptidase M23 [Flavobacteriales bacterium]